MVAGPVISRPATKGYGMKTQRAANDKPTRFRVDRVIELMRERGLTQGDLAKYLRVAAPQVSRWLSGVNYPNLDTLTAMCDFFNVSADFLLGRVGENVAYYKMPELSPDEWDFVLSIRDGSWADALKKLADEMAKRTNNNPHEGSQES